MWRSLHVTEVGLYQSGFKKSSILNYGGFRCKCILFHKIFDGVDCVRSKTLLNQSITPFGDMGNPL